MSNLGALAAVPLVDRRGFMTREWFRYLTGANPANAGDAHQVLHGNPSGTYPTWGPVDLTDEVTGQLPVANGGLGGLTRNPGGVLFFPDANSVASSPTLAANSIMVGGSAAGPSTPLGFGTTTQVLHGNAFGLGSWGPVRLTLDVTGVLPITNGGTGSSFGTGTGAPVFANGPAINNASISTPTITAGTWSSAHIVGNLFWNSGASNSSQIDGNDSVTVTFTTGPATLVSDYGPICVVVHDKTVGGMALVVMDAFGGAHAIYNGLTGISFTATGGAGLQVTVTSGPATRTLSAFSILTGPP